MHMNIDNMETASAKGIEDRFSAAVNVIRGLPKNGKSIFCFVSIYTVLLLFYRLVLLLAVLFQYYFHSIERTMQCSYEVDSNYSIISIV